MKHCSISGTVVLMSQKCNRIDVGGVIACVESPSRGNVDFHAQFLCFVRGMLVVSEMSFVRDVQKSGRGCVFIHQGSGSAAVPAARCKTGHASVIWSRKQNRNNGKQKLASGR